VTAVWPAANAAACCVLAGLNAAAGPWWLAAAAGGFAVADGWLAWRCRPAGGAR